MKILKKVNGLKKRLTSIQYLLFLSFFCNILYMIFPSQNWLSFIMPLQLFMALSFKSWEINEVLDELLYFRLSSPDLFLNPSPSPSSTDYENY